MDRKTLWLAGVLALCITSCGTPDSDRNEPDDSTPDVNIQACETLEQLHHELYAAADDASPEEMEAVIYDTEETLRKIGSTAEDPGISEPAAQAILVLQEQNLYSEDGNDDEIEGHSWYLSHLNGIRIRCRDEYGYSVPLFLGHELVGTEGESLYIDNEEDDEQSTTNRREDLILSCRPLGEDGSASGGESSLVSLDEAWELQDEQRQLCRIASGLSHDVEQPSRELPFDENEIAALEELESDTKPLDDRAQDRAVRNLYERCANTTFERISAASNDRPENHGNPPTASIIAEIEAAMVLCPDHPNFDAGSEVIELGLLAEEQRENGTRFRYGGFVGEDIQPGNYYIEGPLNNCYWETLDSSGNIINNRFVSHAQRIEAQINQNAYTFRSSGCDGEWAPIE